MLSTIHVYLVFGLFGFANLGLNPFTSVVWAKVRVPQYQLYSQNMVSPLTWKYVIYNTNTWYSNLMTLNVYLNRVYLWSSSFSISFKLSTKSSIHNSFLAVFNTNYLNFIKCRVSIDPWNCVCVFFNVQIVQLANEKFFFFDVRLHISSNKGFGIARNFLCRLFSKMNENWWLWHSKSSVSTHLHFFGACRCIEHFSKH